MKGDNPRLLLQDCDSKLSKWFASRPDARYVIRRNKMTLMPFELVMMLKGLIEAIERGDPHEIADLALRYKKWIALHEEKENAN